MDNQAITLFLHELPYLQGLEQRYIQWIADHSRIQKLESQETIFTRDTPAETFYIIFSGEVEIGIPSLFGAPLVLQRLKSNDVLGWSWLISPYKWHFEAVAATKAELICVDGVGLRELCDSNPDFGYQILKRFSKLMMERLDSARMRIIDTYDG